MKHNFFNFRAFLKSLPLEAVHGNIYQDVDQETTIKILNDRMVVDQVIEYDENNLPVTEHMDLKLPQSFDEAVEIFRENSLCFVDRYDERELITLEFRFLQYFHN